MKALKKNDLGVSPVIAVILMVAITVVLAGVVFLWAQSFTDDAGGGVDNVVVDNQFEFDDAGTPADADDDVYTLMITPTSGELDWDKYNLIFEGVTGGATDAYVFTQPTGTTATGLTASITIVGTTAPSVGTEYNYKIVNIEDDNTVVNKDVLLTTA